MSSRRSDLVSQGAADSLCGVTGAGVRPRVLMLTAHDPNGPSYGARMRVQNIARQLQRFGHLTVQVVADPGQTAGKPVADSGVTVDRTYKLIAKPLAGVLGRLDFELNPSCTNTHMLGLRDDDQADLKSAINAHDLVWVHTARVANACGLVEWPSAVLDFDDLYSQVYRSSAAVAGSRSRRLRDLRMAWIWRRREAALLERFPSIAVCSEQDHAYLGKPPGVHVVRNGFAALSVRPDHRPSLPQRFGFIGLMDYEPNRAGIEWFISQVWPSVRSKLPQAKLRLVGKGANSLVGSGSNGVERLGYVDDPAAEIATWSAMVVPIRFGGGTRIKIAEAFARNCPVVATSVGALGYDVRSGHELLMADAPVEFADACIRLATDTSLSRAIRDEAWQRFQVEWSWDASASAIRRALQAVRMGRGRHEPSAVAAVTQDC